MSSSRTTRDRLRRVIGALTALLLAAAGLGGVDSAPAYAATTTTTFTNPAAIQGQVSHETAGNGDTIVLSATGAPSGSTYPSTVNISGVAGTISHVSLQMEFTHTAPDDLDILLVAPSGKTVVLMSDAGGYVDVVDEVLGFNNETTTSLPDTTALSSGFYAATNYVGNDIAGDIWPAPAPTVADPNASLASLLGDSPNGDWNLFVRDDQDQDGGSIAAWDVIVNTGAVPVPAATYPSGLAVSGLTGTVSDIDLTLDGVTWPYSSHLDGMLVSPDGRRALVLSDIGGDQPMTDTTLVLDDEAGAPLPAATAPVSGHYRPTNLGSGDVFPAPAPSASNAGSPLSVFDGANPNGTWKLYLVDDTGTGVAGSLSGGWSLQITTSTGARAGAAPRITSTSPAAHATGVRRGASIRAVASEPLKPSTVTGKTVYLTRAGSTRHVAATVRYIASSHTIVIDPSRRLKAGTKYRVVVTTSVRDTAGTRLDQDPNAAGSQPKTWKFRTA